MVSLARSDKENHVILVNSNKSFEEQNFHGFHELMHIPTANQPGTILSCYEKIKPNQDGYLEWLANEGAAEFTVPYKSLLPMVKDDAENMTKGSGTWYFCEKTASKFNVSPIVIQNRLETLKYETHQYLKGTSLDSIELLSKSKQDKKGIVIKSFVELENERLLHMWFPAI